MDSIVLRPPSQFRRTIGTLGMLGAAATVPVWLLAFPVSAQFDAVNSAIQGSTLVAALVAYACFVRVGARTLEAGWFCFAYSALLALLAGLTAQSAAWERWLVTTTRLAGTLLILVGGIRFMARRPRGRAHPTAPVVRPGIDRRAESEPPR